MDTLVDVNIVDEDNNETSMLAKIVEEGQDTYKVRFMVHVKGDLYNYEDEITEIEKDSVSGFYDSTDERDAGFIKTREGYQPMDDDDNWFDALEDLPAMIGDEQFNEYGEYKHRHIAASTITTNINSHRVITVHDDDDDSDESDDFTLMCRTEPQPHWCQVSQHGPWPDP